MTGADSSIPAPKTRLACYGQSLPRDFPKVAEDSRRRSAPDSEQELATEQKKSGVRRKDLAELGGRQRRRRKNYQRVIDRLQPYKDRVAGTNLSRRSERTFLGALKSGNRNGRVRVPGR